MEKRRERKRKETGKRKLERGDGGEKRARPPGTQIQPRPQGYGQGWIMPITTLGINRNHEWPAQDIHGSCLVHSYSQSQGCQGTIQVVRLHSSSAATSKRKHPLGAIEWTGSPIYTNAREASNASSRWPWLVETIVTVELSVSEQLSELIGPDRLQNHG